MFDEHANIIHLNYTLIIIYILGFLLILQYQLLKHSNIISFFLLNHAKGQKI